MLSFLLLTLLSTASGETVSEDTTPEETTTPSPPPKFNYTESIPDLQSYQNAWEFVAGERTFVMLYRNFNTDPENRSLTNCVKATVYNKSESDYNVVHNISYFNMTCNLTISFLKKYHVISSDGYTTKNVLEGTVLMTNHTEYYPFVFADTRCAVIRKHLWSNDTFQACELWMYQECLTTSTCCDFIFDLLCTRGYKQRTYDTTLCEDKVPSQTEATSS